MCRRLYPQKLKHRRGTGKFASHDERTILLFEMVKAHCQVLFNFFNRYFASYLVCFLFLDRIQDFISKKSQFNWKIKNTLQKL